MYQEIHPCMAGSIDSVKINTSLLMMRECTIFSPVLGDQTHASWPPGFGLAVYRADVCLACSAGELTIFDKLKHFDVEHWW